MPQNEKDQIRFLVVDDTSLARQLVSSALKTLGYTQIDEAADGKSAFLKIRQAHVEGHAFAMVLCDWNMPELDGRELLRSCRASSDFKELPFLMITAEGSRDKVFDTLSAGSTDYLLKPFTVDSLLSRIVLMIEKIQKKTA